MKKILLLILTWSCIRAMPTNAQSKINSIDVICKCEITNSKVKEIIDDYLKRNQVYANENGGIPFVKFYPLGNNQDYYKFVISEQRFVNSLKQNKPKAYTMIKGFPILIYGTFQKFKCTIENYKNVYSYTFKKNFIDHSNEDLKINRKNGLLLKKDINFDPEILEVIVDKDAVISSKELSVQPILNGVN
jgi:hypothetical protein